MNNLWRYPLTIFFVSKFQFFFLQICIFIYFSYNLQGLRYLWLLSSLLCFYGVLRYILTTTRDQTYAPCASPETHPLHTYLPHYIVNNQPFDYTTSVSKSYLCMVTNHAFLRPRHSSYFYK